jgi:hypothetical protein
MLQWMPRPWDHASGGPVDHPLTGPGHYAPQALPAAGMEGPDLEVQVIALIYRSIAAESCCDICGARLVRSLRVLPPPAHAQWPRQLRLITKCRGWRHHVHVASVVINAGDDIPLPPLRAGG